MIVKNTLMFIYMTPKMKYLILLKSINLRSKIIWKRKLKF